MLDPATNYRAIHHAFGIINTSSHVENGTTLLNQALIILQKIKIPGDTDTEYAIWY